MRFLWLDGLRGLAACTVVSFHFFGGANGFGWLAVDFFFVLSGFVLCKSITVAGLNGISGFKIFFKKRILRLYPILLLALSLSFSFQFSEYLFEVLRGEDGKGPAFDTSDPSRYILSIFLLQFLFPFSISLLPPLWSLSTEFYSNLLQLFFRLTGSLRAISICILLGILLIYVSGIYSNPAPDWKQYNTWLFGFGRALIGFNIGQLMWNFHQSKVKLTGKVSLFLILLGIVIPVNVWFLAKELLLFSAYSCFGILVLAFSKLKNTPKKSIVTTILNVLGESSYPIYLFHLIILGFFSRFFASATLVNFVFFYLINLAFSLLVIKYLEPGVKALIRRCLKFS